MHYDFKGTHTTHTHLTYHTFLVQGIRNFIYMAINLKIYFN